MQLPIGSESNFKGIVDLVRMKAVVWEAEGLGAKYNDAEIPDDMLEQAKEYRIKLIEAAVELDDDAMEAYLEGNMPDAATLKKLIRKGGSGAGVFVSGVLWLGVQEQGRAAAARRRRRLSAFAEGHPPDPGSGFPHRGEPVVRQASDDEPLSVLAFKIMDDPFVGSLTFCRIYSGKLETGMGLLNSTRDKKERVGRMLLMHSNNREDIKEAHAGDIVALAGLKDTRTGDTLCDPNKSPVILEKMNFPEPVIEIAIEPKSKADQEKLGVALAKMVAEDPSFTVHTDQESGQTRLKGMGELHLDIKVDILKRTYKVEANIGAPQVAYRETLGASCGHRLHAQEADGRHGPVRPREDHVRAERAGRRRLCLRKQLDVGGAVPKDACPASTRASPR